MLFVVKMFVSSLQEFVAKTKSERNPLLRSFLVGSTSDFASDLEEGRLLFVLLRL